MTPWQAVTDLLDCAVTQLEAQDPPLLGAPSRQFVAAAQVAWDDCCQYGGQVWTRVISAEPQNPLGVKDDSPAKCRGAMAVHVGVGVVRCAHSLDDQGDPPPADALTGDARQIIADMVSLRAAVVCCFDTRLLLGTWATVTDGGCVAGEWDLWVPANFTEGGSP